MVCPHTSGLSVKDYLDAKEGKYKEFLHKTVQSKLQGGKGGRAKGKKGAYGTGLGMVSNRPFEEDSSYVEEEVPGIGVQTSLSRGQQVGGGIGGVVPRGGRWSGCLG